MSEERIRAESARFWAYVEGRNVARAEARVAAAARREAELKRSRAIAAAKAAERGRAVVELARLAMNGGLA